MKILIYGDSNTFGWMPNLNGYSKDVMVERYNKNDIWWSALAKGNELIVNGCPGRAIANDSPWLVGRNATKTMKKDFDGISVDIAIFQLGTNDCKSQYALSANEIAEYMKVFAQKAKKMLGEPVVVVISPAKIVEGNKITDKYYVGAQKKSTRLDECYKKMCSKNGFSFVSGLDLETGEDGEHLTKEAHKMLGNRVLEKISKICKKEK